MSLPIHRLFVCVWLVACASENVSAPPPAPINWASFDVHAKPDAQAGSDLPSERVVANRYLAAISDPSFAPLAKLLDENVHVSAWGTRDQHGRERVVGEHEALFGAFDKRSFQARRTLVQHGALAIEWTMTGIHARKWMGLAPSQHAIVAQGVTLLTTQDDGDISDVRTVFDVGAVKAQITATAPSVDPGLVTTEWMESAGDANEAANSSAVGSFLDDLAFDRPSFGAAPTSGGPRRAATEDEAAYVGAATDDVVLESHGSVQRGRDSVRTYFRTMRKAIGQLDVTVLSTWAAGPYVVVEYTLGGEQLAAIGAVPLVPERVVLIDTIDVLEFRDGKVAHVRRYDNLDALSTSATR